VPILTLQEAADILKYNSSDEMPGNVTSIILPAVDDCIKTATGKDWGTLTDTYIEIDPTAKMIASVLVVRWFEDPGIIGKVNDAGIIGLIGQLHAKALMEVET